MHYLDLLFPGIIVHEAAHALACIVGGVPVHHVEIRSRSGKVVHQSSNLRNSVLISLAPLLIGFVVSTLLFSWSKTVLEQDFWLGVLGLWVAFSIAFHSIPSFQDMSNVVSTIGRQLSALWSGPRHVGVKLAKSAWYAGLWPFAAVGVGIAWLVGLTLLARIGWALAVGWIA